VPYRPFLRNLIALLVVWGALASALAQEPRYRETFEDLYRVLGERYGAFELKGIDWEAVGVEFLPRAAVIADDRAFGLLCLELMARLEDSHANLRAGSHELPQPDLLPVYDAGFCCLEDDRGLPVIYHVEPDSTAAKARLRPGMTVLEYNGAPVADAIDATDAFLKRYAGYSSHRYRRYHAVRLFARQTSAEHPFTLVLRRPDGGEIGVRLTAPLSGFYMPRRPVPLAGINDSASVAWKKLPDKIGYIAVRRIRAGLEQELDAALRGLGSIDGLVIDVRGNSGGGFDVETATLNFDPSRTDIAPGRPRHLGPIALLLDPRCISAGEGWASWFVATGRARTFGEGTAGASARKEEYTLLNGYYVATIPVKPYRGSLDRPIERLGLVPDVPLRQTAEGLAAGRDDVLEAAMDWLRGQSSGTEAP